MSTHSHGSSKLSLARCWLWVVLDINVWLWEVYRNLVRLLLRVPCWELSGGVIKLERNSWVWFGERILLSESGPFERLTDRFRVHTVLLNDKFTLLSLTLHSRPRSTDIQTPFFSWDPPPLVSPTESDHSLKKTQLKLYPLHLAFQPVHSRPNLSVSILSIPFLVPSTVPTCFPSVPLDNHLSTSSVSTTVKRAGSVGEGQEEQSVFFEKRIE